MVLEVFFGIALLVVVVYVLFRIIGNVALGAVLVIMIFIASYFLLGSFPGFQNIPVIGKFIPTTGKIIASVKDFAYSIDIIGVSKSSNDNLLVTVVNTGKSELSNFTAYVDDNEAGILNQGDALESGKAFILELDWKEDFEGVLVKSGQAEAVYKKS